MIYNILTNSIYIDIFKDSEKLTTWKVRKINKQNIK